MIPEHQLKSMCSRSEVERDFRLPLSEMAVVIALRNWEIRCGQISIYDEVMMPGSVLLHACRGNAHSTEPETNNDRRSQRLAIARRNKIDPRVIRAFAARDPALSVHGQGAEPENENRQDQRDRGGGRRRQHGSKPVGYRGSVQSGHGSKNLISRLGGLADSTAQRIPRHLRLPIGPLVLSIWSAITHPTLRDGLIRGRIKTVLPKLQAWKIDAKVLRTLSGNILREALTGEFADYAGSEQAAMALQTIVFGYYDQQLLDDAAYDALERGELTKLLASVDDPDTFNPDKAKKAFKALQGKLKGK